MPHSQFLPSFLPGVALKDPNKDHVLGQNLEELNKELLQEPAETPPHGHKLCHVPCNQHIAAILEVPSSFIFMGALWLLSSLSPKVLHLVG